MKRSPLVMGVVGLALLVAFPMVADNPYYIHLLETIMIYAIVLFGPTPACSASAPTPQA